MKINFNSLNLSLAGGNRFIFELTNGLVERGHGVTITHAGLPEYKNWFTPIKAKVIQCEVPKTTRVLNKIGIKHENLLLIQQTQLMKHSPNCDVNVATFWATASPTLDSKKGKPYYLIQHYEPTFYPENSQQAKDAASTYNLCMTKLCVSKWLTEKVGGVNIGNGINVDAAKVNSELKVPHSVMFSIRSQTYKNSHVLVKLAKLLQGKGYYVLATNENVSEEALNRMYNQAEIFVNVSDKEGYGYQPLEAMAHGCYVFSTPCSEYLNAENHVPIEELSAEYIIQRILDFKPYDKMLKAGHETVNANRFDGVVDRFLEAVT
jgi:hypothetical protein